MGGDKKNNYLDNMHPCTQGYIKIVIPTLGVGKHYYLQYIYMNIHPLLVRLKIKSIFCVTCFALSAFLATPLWAVYT